MIDADKSGPFTGFIDFSASPFALGDILIWNMRVCCEALCAGRSAVDVVALTDPKMLGNAFQGFLTPTNLLPVYLDLAQAFYVNPLLNNFYHLQDRGSFERMMQRVQQNGQPMFPGSEEYARGLRTRNALYNSHAPMNAFFEKFGYIPKFKVPRACAAQAESLLRSLGPNTFAVTVHIRRRAAESNAMFGGALQRDGNLEVWEEFFNETRRRHPETVFIILGRSTEWPRRFMRHPNLVLLKCLGLGLLDEFAMIQASDLFMGLLSGPSNMGFFSDTPYALFVQQSNAQITAGNHDTEVGEDLPFAQKHQNLLWHPPTLENLLAAFEEKHAALRGRSGA